VRIYILHIIWPHCGVLFWLRGIIFRSTSATNIPVCQRMAFIIVSARRRRAPDSHWNNSFLRVWPSCSPQGVLGRIWDHYPSTFTPIGKHPGLGATFQWYGLILIRHFGSKLPKQRGCIFMCSLSLRMVSDEKRTIHETASRDVSK